MTQPPKININLLKTIKECGSDESHTEFNVAIIFRTLLLIDSFHDFTNNTRTNQTIPDTIVLAKHILRSFKNDLLRIIKINPNINDKDFFEDLLKNHLSIPNFQIYKYPLPPYNKSFSRLDPKETKDEAIIDRIFNNLSQDNNTAPLLQGQLNPKKSTIGIFPNPTPSFISSKFINTSKTSVNIILNKFTGKIQSNINKATIYDYSTQPMYIFNYNEDDLIFEFTNNESEVLLCVLHIFLQLCVITQKFNSSTSAPAALELFTKKLMTLLGFDLQFRLTKDGYTPWGFIHNIYCSKLNSDLKKPPCNTKTNTNHYPNISLTIDSESSHSSKDYLNTQLEKFFKNKSNPQEVQETREAILELNEAIEDYNLTEKKTDKEDNDSFAYFLEYAYTQILPEESSRFVLARTTATNFDAAPSGNLSKTISRLSKVDGTTFSGVINENSEKYIYDIKVTSGNIPILDFKYSPLSFNKCNLTLTNWFGLSCNKSHDTTNSSQGTKNGYSLSKAIANFKSSNDIFDIHFKTLTDSGQAFCFYGLQKFENQPNFVYIFHTLDTFCGAISSIINPGTIIERTDQHKQDAKYGDEEFIKSIYSTYNHVYCSKKTLDKANKNIEHFQNFDYFNKNLKLLLQLFVTKKKLDAETLRAFKERQAKEAAETARSQERKRASEERQGKQAETRRADDAVIAKETAETALYDRAFKDAQRIAKEQAHKLTKQIREEQDKSDEDDIEQLLFNVNKKHPLQTKVESPRTKLFGSPKRETKRREKRRKKSKKKREKKRRKKSKRTSGSSSFRRSPAQSRSPSHKRRKVQSSIPPNSNSKKRSRSSTSNSPPAKRSRRHSPTASGKKTRRKNKK